MRAVLVLLMLAPAALAAPSLETRDEEFRTAVARLADRDGDHVAGWGTVRLDGSMHRYRFATLVPDGMGRGAYVIEQAAGVYWLLAFRYDGRTQPFWSITGHDATPAWTQLEDTAMLHSQTFHRGGEWFELGLRGKVLVVLDYEHSDAEDRASNVHHTFARDLGHAPEGTITGGRCPERCPRLAGFPIVEAELAIDGPSATVDELHDTYTGPLP